MFELSPDTAAQLLDQLEALGIEGAKRATLEVAFLVAASDGQVTPLELAQLSDALEAALGDPADDVAREIERLAERLRDEGWDARARSAASLVAGAGQSEPTYRLALSVALVDDQLSTGEETALAVLADALGITPDRRQQLAQDVRAELFG